MMLEPPQKHPEIAADPNIYFENPWESSLPEESQKNLWRIWKEVERRWELTCQRTSRQESQPVVKITWKHSENNSGTAPKSLWNRSRTAPSSQESNQIDNQKNNEQWHNYVWRCILRQTDRIDWDPRIQTMPENPIVLPHCRISRTSSAPVGELRITESHPRDSVAMQSAINNRSVFETVPEIATCTAKDNDT